jgi:hypothetical protein
MNDAEYKQSLMDSNPEAWLSLLEGLTMRSLCVPIPVKGITRDEGFRAELDKAIQAVGGFAFVRTSLRSPKDSKHAIGLQKRFVKEKLQSSDKMDDNGKMILLLESALRGMKIRSSEEAIELLLTRFVQFDIVLFFMMQKVTESRKIWLDFEINVQTLSCVNSSKIWTFQWSFERL